MDKIAVLDFGGQYAHLIANKIRRLGVYTEILDGDVEYEKLLDFKGIILSGGPASVREEGSVRCDKRVFEIGVPILGICYGHQLTAYSLGGDVEKGHVREYGHANVSFKEKKKVFETLEDVETVWMSHFDQVVKEPEGFDVVASSEDCPIAAMVNYDKNIYTLQFHPEVTHTPCGMKILENFVDITLAQRSWDMSKYMDQILEEIKEKVGDKKVFLMISGGVDSTVAFVLLEKALGKGRVYGLFVDIGFMRKGEREQVEASLRKLGVDDLHVYEAKADYLKALEGVIEPEQKRVIIGDLFLDIQAKVSDELGLNGDDWMLGQGTIYPDTIETGGTKHADKIKTHHNRVQKVQDLIDAGKVIEPIAQLYKDEVREVGRRLGLDPLLVERHPFPGPGLAVRMLCSEGEDYPENVAVVDDEINKFLESYGYKAKVLPIKSVGVQGDERTYKHPVMLYGKPVDWGELNSLSTQLTNRFDDVNRVVYGLNVNGLESLTAQKTTLTADRILTIQEADKIVMDYLVEAGIYKEIWQFPTVLLPVAVNSQVGESIVLRPVCSEEAMTANFYHMMDSHVAELVKRLSGIAGVTGVFYDITNKPPGTIEWE